MAKAQKADKPKTSIAITKKKKILYRELDEYKDLFTHRLTPAPILFIEKLSEQIVEWAYNNEDALVLDRFWFSKGISTMVIYNWRKKHKVLDNACLLAKQMIGIRREEGGLTKKLDSNMVTRTAAMYSLDWKALEEWRAKINQKEDKSDTSNITFVLEQFPDSKLVPVKAKEDD